MTRSKKAADNENKAMNLKNMMNMKTRWMLTAVVWTVLLVCVCQEGHAAAKAGSATVKVSETTTVSLAATYQRTLSKSTNITFRWSTTSSNITITSQTRNSATIRGVAAGSAQLNYHCSYFIDGYYRTMDFYYDITIGSNGPTGITISPTSVTLDEGDTYTVRATQTGAIGGTYFTTSNSSVVSVSTGSYSGYTTPCTITARSAGTAYVYAHTMNGLQSSACVVTVKARQVYATSLSLNAPSSMTAGDTYRLAPSYLPANATVSFQYASSDSQVLTVSSSGLITAVSAGTAKVTVKEIYSGITRAVNIEVLPVFTKGDANGDGTVDIADAVCIVNHVVGKDTPSYVAAAADANSDGVVDIADAVRIVNLVVGKIDALAPRFEFNLPEPQ